jgi:hypothetical protein
MPIDWEARIAAAIAAEHEFMIATVGQALGEYGDNIEKKIAEEVAKLRIESGEGKVVLLPNPLNGRLPR